jgi:hypothetical protein
VVVTFQYPRFVSPKSSPEAIHPVVSEDELDNTLLKFVLGPEVLRDADSNAELAIRTGYSA